VAWVIFTIVRDLSSLLHRPLQRCHSQAQGLLPQWVDNSQISLAGQDPSFTAQVLCVHHVQHRFTEFDFRIDSSPSTKLGLPCAFHLPLAQLLSTCPGSRLRRSSTSPPSLACNTPCYGGTGLGHSLDPRFHTAPSFAAHLGQKVYWTSAPAWSPHPGKWHFSGLRFTRLHRKWWHFALTMPVCLSPVP
jgi:hypothetical protein